MSRETQRLRFVPIAEVVASCAAEPRWIWHGYLAEGTVTLLAGRPKVGKSTLVFELMAAIGAGRPCCSRATRRSRIVILSEERASTFADKARRTTWPDGIEVLLHHSAYGVPWPEIVGRAAEQAGADGLLIVDTLADFAELLADTENAAGAVQTAVRPLQEAAAGGCAVLVVAHQRKAAGEHGEAIRGSNALTAAVDVVLELERAAALGPNARVLRAVSRFSEGADDLVLALTEDGYESRGELEGAIAAAERDRVADALGKAGETTADELAGALELAKPTVQRHLNALLVAGRAARAGAGKKGDPYRWSLKSDATEQSRYGRIESQIRTGADSDSMRSSDSKCIESDGTAAAAIEERPAEHGSDGPMVEALRDLSRVEPRWLSPLGELP